ncbi:hypothetical protein [Pseudogracilibacillus sp. SO30301A]|uniref:hypothetical protein n=1 Tax=Pseudogracilibacillus sp. SO30301A TaxID=3098291 RepID=UPI00300E695C
MAQKRLPNEVFYHYKVIVDGMGEKTMLKEKKDIHLSEQFDEVTVTLDGYQFTVFTPNSRIEDHFTSFDNGIVLLTVIFLIDNAGKEEMGLASINSRIHIGDGSACELSDGFLL